VESVSGQGSTFHFTILARSSSATTPPNWQTLQPQLAGKHILAVEDNPTNCRIMRHRAEQWGLLIECVHTGKDALALLADAPPLDALILDLQLPDMDALALAEEIRKLPSCASVPILLLSSARLRSDDGRPSRLGISVVAHKPIRPAQLLDALCRAMNIQLQREKKAPSTPSLDVTFAKRHPLRVLLADDNPINQKVGFSLLQKLGYRADLASNGIEVLQALEHKAYDIIFLDVQMPEMDGLETTRKICDRWPREQRPCIIAMTGNAVLGDRDKCLAAGMDDYISKPVRVGELQDALEHWGPTRVRKSDTTFLLRTPLIPRESLLDEAILEELREMSPADEENIVRELVDLFLDGAPQRLLQIKQSLADPLKLVFHAHALKSMGLNLGAKRVVELCQQLEDLGSIGNLTDAPTLLRELEVAFVQTKQLLLPLRET
jgi:CheY-like chemotaxis protein/HPt (histidine-containing phosphotransfer) domain-containing protein